MRILDPITYFLLIFLFLLPDTKNSDSESLTNEDSSDNQINTVFSQDFIPSNKSTGKNQLLSSDSVGSQSLNSKPNNFNKMLINKESLEKINSQDSPITPVKESVPKDSGTPTSGIKNKKIETSSAKKGSTKKSRHR